VQINTVHWLGLGKETSAAQSRVREMFAAFAINDRATLATLVTHDVRLQLMNNDVVEGQQAFAAEVDGESVIAELFVHYTRHDGQRVTLPCCNVFRLRDGSIYDYRSYMDISPVYA